MKTDIILAGVGGQGILSIAAAISLAALENGLEIKQSEVHGMSQRGGAVQSHLRISHQPIASDTIPLGKADLILAVEPMEALRYLDFMSENAWIVSSSNPFKNIENYPDESLIYSELKKRERVILIDSDEIASRLGNKLGSNMVMLGAASLFINLDFELLEQAVVQLFVKKGQIVVDKNIQALKAGREFALSNSVQEV